MCIIYYYSAITCVAPTITNGAHNCANAGSTAWDGTCTATCDSAAYHLTGTALITCNVDNSGTGGWDATPTCPGMHLLFTQSTVTRCNLSAFDSFEHIIFSVVSEFFNFFPKNT